MVTITAEPGELDTPWRDDAIRPPRLSKTLDGRLSGGLQRRLRRPDYEKRQSVSQRLRVMRWRLQSSCWLPVALNGPCLRTANPV